MFTSISAFHELEKRESDTPRIGDAAPADPRLCRLDRLFDGLSQLHARPAKRFEQRGQGLIDYMNKCRSEKQSNDSKGGVSPAARATLQKYNKRFACHRKEVCDVKCANSAKQKSKTIKGRGRHKRYVGNAVARCAWGFPCRKDDVLQSVEQQHQHESSGNKTNSRRRKRNRSACLVSKNAMHDGEGAARSHLVKCRKAVSEKVLIEAERAYRSGTDCDTKILELSIDETETPMRMESANEIGHLCMMHGREWRCHDEPDALEKFFELVMPPSPLADTSAQSIVGAVRNRLSRYTDIADLRRSCKRLNICMNTDSAPSCIAGGRGLGVLIRSLKLASTALLPCRCQAHLVVLSMVDIVRVNKLINGLYCFFTQMSQHKNLRGLRQSLHYLVRKKLNVIEPALDDSSFDVIAPHEFTDGIIRLLELGDKEQPQDKPHVRECWHKLASKIPKWHDGCT